MVTTEPASSIGLGNCGRRSNAEIGGRGLAARPPISAFMRLIFSNKLVSKQSPKKAKILDSFKNQSSQRSAS